MKRERLVANVNPAGSPDRAVTDVFGMISAIFWPAQANLVPGSHFVIEESSLEPQ